LLTDHSDSNARGEINVKITDFGLSRFSQVGVVGMEKNQNAAGPLKWMAPGTLLSATRTLCRCFGFLAFAGAP
jgi:serine/threonine protein kinase